LFYETNESVFLSSPLEDSHRDSMHAFVFHIPGQGTNVTIETSYRLGSTELYGDRPPLVRFVVTKIQGFTTEPLILTNYWSQTFSVTHRPGSENFIFEPRLEPNVSATQLAELTAKDIAYFYLHRNGIPGELDPGQRPILKVIGFDGTFRTFSDQDFTD
jgi:hypothetical protein